MTAFEGIHHNLKNEGLFGISTLFGMAPITLELIDLIGPDKAHELREKQFLEPVESYESLANACGLCVTKKSPLPVKYSFPVIDDLLKSLYGATHGIFDPSVIEGQALENFKTRYFQK